MTSYRAFALSAVLTLSGSWASPALAQDADLDGALDAVDAFPCDPTASGMSFAPAEGRSGSLLFEDNWPEQGDLDFNDVALAYHYVFHTQADGRVRRVTLTIDGIALGGNADSGLGLVLPVPRAAVASVSRRIGAGASESLAWAADPQLTVRILDNLRALFGGATGVINARPDLPRTDGGRVVLEIALSSAVTLPIPAAPFDLFVFRSNDPSHEIHRPEFAGTSAMDGTLFGTADDGSSAARHFVDRSGLPFALSFPVPVDYPRDWTELAQLYPRIADFAASGGASARDFYLSPVPGLAWVDPAQRGRFVPAAVVTEEADDSCVPVCVAGYHVENNVCTSDTRACAITNGTGRQTWNGSGYGACAVTACNSGFQITGNTCTASSRLIFITSGNYTGNLGGLEGADATCQALASNAGLPGTFRAWLSSSGTSAANRLTRSTAPYRLVNGVTVANNWNDLTDGTIAAPISITERGASKIFWVWTGSNVSGGPYSNMPCSNWTSATSASGGNFVGRSGQTNCRWTNASANNPDGGDCVNAATTLHCSNAFALYCLQQ